MGGKNRHISLYSAEHHVYHVCEQPAIWEKNTVTSNSVGCDFFSELSPVQQQTSLSSTSLLPAPHSTPGNPLWLLLMETPSDFALFGLTQADSIFS